MSSKDENRAREILEYIDLFGTKIGFYAEGKPKFYTPLGGILSILSIIISVISFILFSLDDFKRVSPTTTLSSITPEEYHRIKFDEQKIWLPIRITDNYYNFINHTGLIYPEIRYYYAERNNLNETFEIKFKKLNYKLCSETSMANKTDIYKINIPLNQLYCIDTKDIEIGGFWDSTFFGYLKIDLYFCENGKNYDNNNSNCTTYDKKIKKIGFHNSLKFDIFYPTVQFQPLNYKNPIIILYRDNSYQISKYSIKISKLTLQQYVLSDDRGWFYNNIVSNSYYGISSLNSDDYTALTKNLINQENTSLFYSLEIYLESGITLYTRKYKKILSIFIEALSKMYIVFIIFDKIAQLSKSTEENKLIIELLFENFKEKPNKFEKTLKTIKYTSKEFLDYSRSNLIMQSLRIAPKENIISDISPNLSPKNKNDISKKEEKQKEKRRNKAIG